MESFGGQVDRWVKETKKKIDEQVRSITIGLFNDVILGSPVGNREIWAANIKRKEKGLPPLPKGYVGGLFRGGWQTSVGQPVATSVHRIDPSGAQAISEVVSTVPEQAGSIVYLTNNLPYAQRLEYEGWSKQAPAGMVRVNMARIADIMKESE